MRQIKLNTIILLLLLIVVVGIYVFYPSIRQTEGFTAAGAPGPATGEPMPNDQTAELPVAPYGQVAKTAPSMWTDGSREATTTKRLQATLESLRAFLTFEAPQLEETSDPAVQIPLLTVKGDLKALESEATFLERNPGLKPTITMKQINDIEDNLEGLKRRARSLQGVTEGFTSPADCPVASLEQVKSLNSRISQEIARLSANGTIDPVLTARINNLKSIQQGVQAAIDRGDVGDIYTCDIDNFLKVLGSDEQQAGIPSLVRSSGISNLFPSGTDAETEKQVSQLLDSYGQKLLDGLSGGIALYLKYTSKNEVDIARAAGVATGAAAGVATGAAAGADIQAQVTGISGSSNIEVQDQIQGQAAPAAQAAQAAAFDWKKRSAEICAAVKRRGLNPADFGCMSPATEVSSDFNWRGHAKMVCSRLSTSYETGLPELVGCPDFKWSGWTSKPHPD